MQLHGITIFILSLLHCILTEVIPDLSCSGDSIFSRLSAYNPLNNTNPEFSTLDFHGQTLKTLQDYLKGLTAYVTVAMDTKLLDNQIPYGTLVCIPKLNEKYGKKIRFEVRDTRSDLEGLGFNRAAICVSSTEDLTEESVNSLVNMRLPSGTIADEDDEMEEIVNSEKKLTADVVNYPGLREDYSAQKRDQYGSSSYYYPPYYYYPPPHTTTKKPTTTQKPYYPYPYPPYPYYQPYPPPPPPPPPPPMPPYYNYYHQTTTTNKPPPYYPPANAYYYYPYPSNHQTNNNNMYGYSSYYNVSYDPPTPNYKPMAISNTQAPSSHGSYPSYHQPPPPSNNYNQYPSSYGSNSYSY